MDFGGGGSAGGSGGDESGQGTSGNGGMKRKWDDFEATMKAMKDALVNENEEKSAKIRKLMEETVRLKQDNARLEETVFRLQNPSDASVPIRGVPLQDPFTLFPYLVWQVFIEKMNRSSDLERLCLAYPQLETLVMERKKTIVLFKNVFPLVWKHLLRQDIYNCRLVCGTWNEDVSALVANGKSPNLLPKDALLTNNQIFTKTPLPDPQLVDLDRIFRQWAYRFHSPEKIQNFLEEMAGHSGNPFVGRSILFDVDFETDVEQLWNSALEMLRKFGEHVWNLEIIYDSGGFFFYDQIEFYKEVQQLLIHLPNLRYLAIDNQFKEEGPSKADMAVEIQKSPLPPLPYLQSLNLDLNGGPGISNAFSTYFSSQIRRLVLLKDSFADLTNGCLRGLLHVEQLEVELHSKNDVSRLLKFPNPKNVRKLRLHASSSCPDPPKSPVSFAPEQFASLLETFSGLEGPLDIGRCLVDLSLSSFLRSREWFSGLTTLKIGVGFGEDERHHNLDFLLLFQSLKHLVIRRLFIGTSDITSGDYDQHSMLKICSYLTNDRVLESNIWTLMPSLQSVKTSFFTTNIFTREMYENLRG